MIYSEKLEVVAGTPAIVAHHTMSNCSEHAIQTDAECEVAYTVGYNQNYVVADTISNDAIVLAAPGITGIRITSSSGTANVTVTGG